MRDINEIIIHCSATREGDDISAKTIDKWHRDRGFNCIGYHYVIRLNGRVEIGRPLLMVGAHCLNHNAHSVGICYIGGLDKQGRAKDTRTPEQKIAMNELIGMLQDKFTITSIVGHRKYANKECPCFNVEAEYKP